MSSMCSFRPHSGTLQSSKGLIRCGITAAALAAPPLPPSPRRPCCPRRAALASAARLPSLAAASPPPPPSRLDRRRLGCGRHSLSCGRPVSAGPLMRGHTECGVGRRRHRLSCRLGRRLRLRLSCFHEECSGPSLSTGYKVLLLRWGRTRDRWSRGVLYKLKELPSHRLARLAGLAGSALLCSAASLA